MARKALSQTRPNRPPLPDGLDAAAMLRLYEQMTLLRRFELAAQIACRKGETPGLLHLYIGEEAVATGVCAHLRRTDSITSTHRGHGHALAKGMDPRTLMAELYGKRDGSVGGRGGTMHLYERAIGLFGTNGVVASGAPQATGAAISAKYRGTDGVAVAFFGDGAVDGNEVVAMWTAMRAAAERARAGEGPTLIEAKTYRTVGHHEGDPVIGSYRTQDEVDAWTKRCPIATFRTRLIEEFGIATPGTLAEIEQRVDDQVQDSVEYARAKPDPDPATVMRHVYADPINPADALAAIGKPPPTKFAETSWLDAVRDGIAEEMRRDRNILYYGEGTGERGGMFAHTKGLYQAFGPERMVDTPISKLGFTGAALGASATGLRVVADPVLMLETKALFASKGPVPDGEHLVPFGLARIARKGRDLTIAATGQMVHRSLEAAEALAADGIEAEVIDLRTIQPLDVETVAESVAHTHHLLVVDEGWPIMGVGAELGQAMNEIAFDQLDSPVARLHTAPWRWRGRPDGVQASIATVPMQPAPPPAPRRLDASPSEPIAMPFGDLTIDSGKLVRSTVADGAKVKKGEIIAEIETDKAVLKIEAPSNGAVAQTVKEAGTVVKMGGVIGVVMGG